MITIFKAQFSETINPLSKMQHVEATASQKTSFKMLLLHRLATEDIRFHSETTCFYSNHHVDGAKTIKQLVTDFWVVKLKLCACY